MNRDCCGDSCSAPWESDFSLWQAAALGRTAGVRFGALYLSLLRRQRDRDGCRRHRARLDPLFLQKVDNPLERITELDGRMTSGAPRLTFLVEVNTSFPWRAGKAAARVKSSAHGIRKLGCRASRETPAHSVGRDLLRRCDRRAHRLSLGHVHFAAAAASRSISGRRQSAGGGRHRSSGAMSA